MNPPFKILYEDNHLLVVNKPAGMLVQGDATGDKPLVEHAKDYIGEKYNKPGAVYCGVVHRIDRPVSGVVILARTSKALERLNRMFKDREVTKLYWALVSKRPQIPEDTLTHWLIKDSERNITSAYNKAKNGAQIAILSYKLTQSFKHFNMLEVMPTTGRPHQIRVQLAKIGCPIIGDLRYGHLQANTDASICLHAREITLRHPVKQEMLTFTAAVPNTSVWQEINR